MQVVNITHLPRKVGLGISLLAFLGISNLSVTAAEYTWSGGGGNNNWTTANNWVGGAAPDYGDTTDIVFTGNTRLEPNQGTGGWGAIIRNLTFDAAAGAFNSKGNVLAIHGDIQNLSANTQTLNNSQWEVRENATQTNYIKPTNGDIVLNGIYKTQWQYKDDDNKNVNVMHDIIVDDSNNGHKLIVTGDIRQGGSVTTVNSVTLEFDTPTTAGNDGFSLFHQGGTTLKDSSTVRFLADNVARANAHFLLEDSSKLDINGTSQSIRFINSNGSNSQITLGTEHNSGSLTLIGSKLNAGDNAYNGKITGYGDLNVNLTTATHLWTIGNAANDYVGDTYIDSLGGIQLGTSNVLPNSTVVRMSSGKLDLNGHNESIKGLDGTGGVVSHGGTNNSTSTITLGTETTVADSYSFSGTIEDGSGSRFVAVTKVGDGIQTLAGSNTYTGDTLVSAGTLYITGALGGSDVTVGEDGTIGGSGTVGGNLHFEEGAGLDITLGTLELTEVAAILSFDGFTFENILGLEVEAASTGVYDLVRGSFILNSDSVENFGESNAKSLANGNIAWFDEAASGGFVLNIIPEPGTALLGGIGVLLMIRRRRC